jgi:hypothetical protein
MFLNVGRINLEIRALVFEASFPSANIGEAKWYPSPRGNLPVNPIFRRMQAGK